MFCKFCGQNIPDTSEFCPECGKKLKKEEAKEQEAPRAFSLPLALMLIMLCWSTVFTWGRVLLLGDRAHIGTLIPTVMLAAGLVLLGTMIGQERIHGDDYRFSDLLVLCCVWMVVPALMWRWESYVVYHMLGQDAGLAWNIWKNGTISAIQFPAFWLVLGLVALGLARSGNWKPTKKHSMALLAVLLLCSVIGILFGRVYAVGMGAPEEVIAMVVHVTSVWSFLCWLWPLVILKVFRALGEGRIGTGGAAVSLLVMQVGEVFLLLVFVRVVCIGVVGCALANGLAPLFGLLILNIAVKTHKKKHIQEVN